LDHCGRLEAIHYWHAALRNDQPVWINVGLPHLVLLTLMKDFEVTRAHFLNGLLAIISEFNLQVGIKGQNCEFHCLNIVQMVVTNQNLGR
jgi:hypothetical protein